MRTSKVARRQIFDYFNEVAPGNASALSVLTEQSEEVDPSLDSSFLLLDKSYEVYDANLIVDEAECVHLDWMSELDNEVGRTVLWFPITSTLLILLQNSPLWN